MFKKCVSICSISVINDTYKDNSKLMQINSMRRKLKFYLCAITANTIIILGLLMLWLDCFSRPEMFVLIIGVILLECILTN